MKGVSTQGEAIDAITKQAPDLIIVSLSLPKDAAYTLIRLIRTNVRTKYTPVFALVVKTETTQQQQALTFGFSSIITNPIDVIDLEARIAKAMNLDTFNRYYATEGQVVVMRLPEMCSPASMAEAATYLKPKFAEAVDAGINKVVIDIHLLRSLHVGIIKLLFQAMQTCRDFGMHFALVGNPQIISECKGFEDTRGWTFYDSLEEAKANLGKSSAPQLAGALS